MSRAAGQQGQQGQQGRQGRLANNAGADGNTGWDWHHDALQPGPQEAENAKPVVSNLPGTAPAAGTGTLSTPHTCKAGRACSPETHRTMRCLETETVTGIPCQ